MNETNTDELELAKAIRKYCDHLHDNYVQMFDGKFRIRFVYDNAGPKYIRIYSEYNYQEETYSGRSSHSFIVRSEKNKDGTLDKHGFVVGDILKSASWKAPATNFIRGNVFDPPSYSKHIWAGL